jgi:hypothetical protein
MSDTAIIGRNVEVVQATLGLGAGFSRASLEGGALAAN